MTTCIDYLAFTYKETDLARVLGFYGRYFTDFAETRGHLGYLSCWRSEGVAIYYDGMPGMGIHVQLSGQGCAAVSNHSSFSSWGALCASILDLGGVATRVDFAFDDNAGLITVDKILKCLEGGEVATRYREHGIRRRARGLEMKEDCLYLGSSKSDNNLCVYDKRLEQMGRGLEDPGHWVRMELRLKSGVAVSAVNWIIANPNLVGVEGILASNVRFLIPSSQKNKTRWDIADWWQEFLSSAAKIKIAAVKELRSVPDRINHFMQQHAATFVMLKTLAEKMYGAVDFTETLLANGSANLRGRHIDTIAVYLREWRGERVAAIT